MVDLLQRLSPIHRIVVASTLTLLVAGCASAPDPQGPPPGPRDFGDERIEGPYDGERLANLIGAELAVLRGNRDEAIDSLRGLAESDDPEVLQYVAIQALRLEDNDLARLVANRWASIEPNVGGPWRVALAVALKDGDNKAAATAARNFLRHTDFDESRRWRVISNLVADRGDPETAIAFYRQLLASHSASADAWFNLGHLAYRLGDSEVVIEANEMALSLRPNWEAAATIIFQTRYDNEQVDTAIDGASRFVEENPEALRLRYRLAVALYEQERFDEAFERFAAMADAQANMPQSGLYAAQTCARLSRFECARDYLKLVVDTTPDQEEARLSLAELAMQLEQYELASSQLDLVKDPQLELERDMLRVRVIQKRDGVDAAVAFLDTIDYGNEEADVQRALVQSELQNDHDDLDGARATLNAIIERYPENIRALYARGLMSANNGDVDATEQDMRRVLEIDPENAQAMNALGYTLTDLTDRHDEALELITRADELNPDDPYTLDSLGWVNYRLGNNEAALTHLKRAYELRQDAEIAAHIGEVLWVTGNEDEARRYWQEGHETDPENRALIETLERFGITF